MKIENICAKFILRLDKYDHSTQGHLLWFPIRAYLNEVLSSQATRHRLRLSCNKSSYRIPLNVKHSLTEDLELEDLGR